MQLHDLRRWNNLRTAFESLCHSGGLTLHFSHNQKRRSVYYRERLFLLLSVFIVIRGNTQSSAAPEIVPVTIAEPEIFVDVTGAVNKPGVYHLDWKIASNRCD